MYEMYNANLKYEGAFTPHPQVMEIPLDPVVVFATKNSPKVYEEKKIEKQPDIIQEQVEENRMESDENKAAEVKEEKGLVVTNNVSYEVKDAKKKSIFKRR